MTIFSKCLYCGTDLLRGRRSDAQFCCGRCQVAHFRRVKAGNILPFAPRQTIDNFIKVAGTPKPAERSAEACMSEVTMAERRLSMARRAASKAFKSDGRDTSGMFSKTEFVPRESANKWVREAKSAPADTYAAFLKFQAAKARGE
jgi:hypothetical protein